MIPGRAPRSSAALRWPLLFVTLLLALGAAAQDAASLRGRYDSLREAMEQNLYQRPLYIESQAGKGHLEGEVVARFEQPFTSLAPALREPNGWCDVLILHPNVKGCQVRPGALIYLDLGNRFAQPLDDTRPLAFRFRVLSERPDYLALTLEAERGPLGTRAHRLTVELTSLRGSRSVLQLSYAHDYGVRTRLTMLGYLTTVARGRPGFSSSGVDVDGQPVLVDGMRGMIERNTMRYYLAVEAYLEALRALPYQRVERRLELWYAGVRRYPLQLQEPERAVYLDMKRREIRRMESLQMPLR